MFKSDNYLIWALEVLAYVLVFVVFVWQINYNVRYTKRLAKRLNPNVKGYFESNKVIRTARKIAKKQFRCKFIFSFELVELMKENNLVPVKTSFKYYKDNIKKPKDSNNLLTLLDGEYYKNVRLNTISVCKSQGVKCFPHYAFCDAEKKYTRQKEEIIDRILCLYVNTRICNEIVNYNISQKEALKLLNKYILNFELKNKFTSLEINMYKSMSKKDLINFSWQYECLETLLWSVGLIENLNIKKEANCCFDVMKTLETKSKQEILDCAKIRDYDELFKMLDLYFICQNSCNYEKYKGKKANLNSEIISERFKALVWLMEDLYEGSDDYNPTPKQKIDEWDDVDISA